MRIRLCSCAWFVIPFLAWTTSACTAIFGMEEGELGAFDAGADATGGMGGTSGTGGTSGGGGSAGATGGAAGTAATGGSAGQAGSAGVGGSAGMAGSAGSAGTAGSAGAGGCPTDCDDGLTCTDDECVQGNCENTLTSGCLIQGACVPDGEVSAANPCEFCDPTQNEYQYSQVADGVDCGAGQVCNGGVCGDCTDGQPCTPATACRVGEIDCSSGSPVCKETGDEADGISCGVDMVCNDGSCESCVAGMACSPADCRVGLTICSTGVQTCKDMGDAPDGTTCGASKICQDGSCVDGCNLSTHACVTPPGGGWSEPFAHVAASQGCQGPFATELGILRNNLSVPASSCDCSCGSPTGSCSSTIDVETHTDSQSCNSFDGGGTFTAPDCRNVGSYSRNILAPEIVATCASGSVASNLSTPTWGVDRVACGAAAGLPCADAADSCVPQPQSPFSNDICVMRSGNVSCPSGFPNRTLYYEDYDETRSCPSSCTCTQSGGYCEILVTGYEGSNCIGADQSTTVTHDRCIPYAQFDSYKVETPTVGSNGFCTPTNPSVSGSASESDPVTVCCLP